MELELNLSPEDGAEISSELASPMGGKHQRNLSVSAKWANNKALALEYLKRQREVMLWIESVLERKLPSHDMHENLKSGIVLRELLAKLYPGPSECLSPISRKYSSRMAPWKERENISVFLKQCKALGMSDLFLFDTEDLFEGTNMVQVLFSVQHFRDFSIEHSNYVVKLNDEAQEPVEFSNQEVEEALSKIEMIGAEGANGLFSASLAPESYGESPVVADEKCSNELILSSEEEVQVEIEIAPTELNAEKLNELEKELSDVYDNNIPEGPPEFEEIRQPEVFIDEVKEAMIELIDAVDNVEAEEEECKPALPIVSETNISPIIPRIQSDSKTEVDKDATSMGETTTSSVTPQDGITKKASTRASRASKRASKPASKATKKDRETSDEQLEAEAMARCVCGETKCTIM